MNQHIQNQTGFSGQKEQGKYLQREWTTGLSQVTGTVTELSGTIATTGIVAGSFYDQGELQTVIDKLDEVIGQVNLLTAFAIEMATRDSTVIEKLNQVIDGLTVK